MMQDLQIDLTRITIKLINPSRELFCGIDPYKKQYTNPNEI